MQKIQDVLTQKVLPVLQTHNGGIEILEVTPGGVVKVKLTGACAACPGAQQTISEIVKTAIKEAFPEIKDVLLVQQLNNELINLALEMLRKNWPSRLIGR